MCAVGVGQEEKVGTGGPWKERGWRTSESRGSDTLLRTEAPGAKKRERNKQKAEDRFWRGFHWNSGRCAGRGHAVTTPFAKHRLLSPFWAGGELQSRPLAEGRGYVTGSGQQAMSQSDRSLLGLRCQQKTMRRFSPQHGDPEFPTGHQKGTQKLK